eukprot:scaffold32794_cov26-Tisochrysis_lutea.AAC.1
MPLSVSYATKDGTAVAGIDYKPVQARASQPSRARGMCDLSMPGLKHTDANAHSQGELKFGPGE